jgi:hypothetical protein
MASSRGASAGTSAVITSDLSFPSLTSKEEEVYSQFVHQTYDLPPAMEEGSPENEDDASECEDISDASTLWEFINFFPIFLQSMAAITNLLHSLVLGNAAQWSISSLTAPLTSPGWVGPAPVGVAWILATDANGKVLDWPPPALIGLALLTIIALMVHPDGFTWILLRKLRYVSAGGWAWCYALGAGGRDILRVRRAWCYAFALGARCSRDMCMSAGGRAWCYALGARCSRDILLVRRRTGHGC